MATGDVHVTAAMGGTLMGMDSGKLSRRKKQPGHDQTYRSSEGNFAGFLRDALNPDLFDVRDKPDDLRYMLPNPGVDGAKKAYGVVPEVAVTSRSTGRTLYFEVKKQGRGGNADERACKHHTVQFQKRLKEVTGQQYHAIITILCEELANYPKYLAKHPYFFEADSYYCWRDYRDKDALRTFLERVLRKTILDDVAKPVLRNTHGRRKA